MMERQRSPRSAAAGTVPFDVVVQRHGATVLRLCRALAGPDDAHDAWSETFLAALRAYPDLPAEANHEAWLVTIAKRKVIDLHRAAGRRALPVADPNAVSTPLIALGADAWITSSDPDLAAAVASLPARQRDSVTLHHLVGLPHAEVATALRCSPAAARKASSDGIATLRRVLGAATSPGPAVQNGTLP